MNHVLLPTTVVGSYSVPEWLERLKTEYYQRRISAQHMAEINEVAIKAAVKDQELAGIDIVSDGELRRDNDVDYVLPRLPGVRIPHPDKADYLDYLDASADGPLPDPGAGLDTGPTELNRGFGMAWGMGGWLLTYFLMKIGPAEGQKLRERVAREIKTTFASHYSHVISLTEALKPEVMAAYNKKSTGEKYLIAPHKS